MAKKIRLIPFDWDKYKKGAQVVRRDEKFTVISVISNSEKDDNAEDKLEVVFRNDNQKLEIVTCYLNGRVFSDEDQDYEGDILIKEEIEERTIWINVYENELSIYYPTKEQADQYQKPNRLGRLKITFNNEDLIK